MGNPERMMGPRHCACWEKVSLAATSKALGKGGREESPGFSERGQSWREAQQELKEVTSEAQGHRAHGD